MPEAEAGDGGGSTVHTPVLVAEVVELLAPAAGARVLDLTVGAGGHAEALLARLGPAGFLVGVDRDPEILARARLRLGNGRVRLIHGDFGEWELVRRQLPALRFDAVIADLGVSSWQLDSPSRGFSFRRDGPLDMRMDASRGRTAAELVAELGEEEMARIFADYGEERNAARIARAIVRARATQPITRTAELAEIVRGAQGRAAAGARIDPATRTFQALRIAVNRELEALDRLLESLDLVLAAGGRIAVIAYHSLEDRRVKDAFRARTRSGEYELVTRHAVRPGATEIQQNPRARSARLRVLAKGRGVSAA